MCLFSRYSKMSKFLLNVEGIIGAGKSTLIKDIVHNGVAAGSSVLTEPVDKFEVYEQYNPLALFYQNPKENVVPFQMHIIRTLNMVTSEHLTNAANTDHINISERGLYSPLVFIETLYKRQILNGFACCFLSKETSDLAIDTMDKCNATYGGIFFIDTPIEECIRRIRHRSRKSEEGGINFDYLNLLRMQYLNHLDYWRGKLGVDRVRVVNSLNRHTVLSEFRAFKEEMDNKIIQTLNQDSV